MTALHHSATLRTLSLTLLFSALGLCRLASAQYPFDTLPPYDTPPPQDPALGPMNGLSIGPPAPGPVPLDPPEAYAAPVEPYFPLEGQFVSGAPIWPGYIAAAYQPGTDRILYNGDLFLPLWQDGHNLWFFDLRGQVDDDDAHEINAGTGIRTIAWPGWILGIYGFYDHLESANGNDFHQGTIGVEAMDVFWDLRFNVYFPESSGKAIAAPPVARISNGTIVVDGGIERAYWGLDVETGALLWAWGPNAQHELRGFLGFYHFDHSAPGFDSITGPRVRLEWRIFDLPYFGPNSRLTLGATAQADDERDGQLFGFIGLRIPLDGWAHHRPPLSQLHRRMLDPIVRDVDVVSNVTRQTEAAVNADTGRPLNNMHILDASDDLAEIIPELEDDAVIVLDGSRGNFTPHDVTFLQSGQMVLGGGSYSTVRGAESGRLAQFRTPGTRPTIDFDAHAYVAGDPPMVQHFPGFVMADESQLIGLDLRGGDPAIIAHDVFGPVIRDIHLQNVHGLGISLMTARGARISEIVVDQP
jgi:hypothetical protein